MSISAEQAGPGRSSGAFAPSEEETRAQLERILASPDFRSAPKRGTLLRFLVEEALAGRGDLLKGFTVAAAVFDRDSSFDAQSDPVVRLAARRLRTALDVYYGTAGMRDPLRISIPKGHYAPLVEWRDQGRLGEATPPPGSAREGPPAGDAEHGKTAAAAGPGFDRATKDSRAGGVRVMVLLAVAMIVAIAGAWLWRRAVPTGESDALGPAVIVLPFEAPGAAEDARTLASGVTQELITDLMRFPDFRLYSVPASFRQDETADPAALGRDLEVTYVIKGSIRLEANRLRLGAQLLDAQDGRVLWSETYDRPLTTNALFEAQSDLAAAIATTIGGSYGVVNRAATQRLRADGAPSMPTYACILQAYEYRRAFSDALFAPALACLEDSVRRDPGYADAWALLGWLHLDAARMGMVPEAEVREEMSAALDAASHAVQLDRGSLRALQALAAVTFYTGDYAESERLQREALALNPNDPETLAQLGWRLAVRGDWDEGLPYLNAAIARTVSPPGWYYHLIAVHDYLEGDYAAALQAAERSSKGGSAIGLSLAAISEAKLGDMDAAHQNLVAMAEAWPLLGRDPAAAFRIHHADDQIVEALVEGLRSAGWTEPVAATP